MATGLHNKYRIEKTDGTPVDPRAEYFVLRIDTDIAARQALLAYAAAVRHQPGCEAFAAELVAWEERARMKATTKAVTP